MADRPNKTGLGDGGPAFPTPCDGFGGMTYGMTLRDWFAGQALAGLIAQSMGTAIGSTPSTGAGYAYRCADAMLAARSIPPTSEEG